MVPPEVLAALDAVAGGATADSQESERLDFKQESASTGDTHRSLLEASLCLANWRGGHVILGVADRIPGPAALLGTQLDPDQVRFEIHSKSRPSLLVDVQEAHYAGTRLLVVAVPRSQEIHSDTKGRAPRRIGTECSPMSPAEQRALLEDKSGVDWTRETAHTPVSVTDTAMMSARRRLNASAKSERRALSRLSDEDLMRALGVVNDTGEVLRAGKVLLGDAGCPVTYIYRETPAGEPQLVEKMNSSLLETYDRVMELIRARRRTTPVTLPDGQQVQVEDFPELAVREALSNAMIHRDYHLKSEVLIDHSPSVLVLTSPGPLVAGVSPDNILTHPSKPRNRVLADAVAIVELAEEIGRGVDRMYREMVRAGRGLPSITETHDRVRVALVGGAPDLNIARYVAQLPTDVRDDTDAMLVILKLCGQKTTHAVEMAPVLQKTAIEAEAALRQLASDSIAIIEPTRQSARRSTPVYRFRETALKALGTAVPYQRHTSDDVARRVIAHVREYDKVTNQTVQNLFNVGMSRANQILRELVVKKVIVKTSEAQRGPSVEYGPGEAFPPKPTRRRRAKTPPDHEPLPGL